MKPDSEDEKKAVAGEETEEAEEEGDEAKGTTKGSRRRSREEGKDAAKSRGVGGEPLRKRGKTPPANRRDLPPSLLKSSYS